MNNSILDYSLFEMEPNRPYWMNVLDKVSTIVMTLNVIFLMLGMGAATYLREVI